MHLAKGGSSQRHAEPLIRTSTKEGSNINSNDELRFPIGRPDLEATVTPDLRRQRIAEIAQAPADLRRAVEGLTAEQLDTPYREGGWTVRQVIHHVPDSHLNAYIRFRQGLVGERPTIMPYDEARWAELPDTQTTPVAVSLQLLEALHDRWVRLLSELTPDQFQRTINHPESGILTLDALLGLYSWHGLHHAAHILNLRRRMGWWDHNKL